MIDTGATGSVIQPALVQQLGLQAVGVVSISTPSSQNVPCYQYSVRLIFPNNVMVEAIAMEAPLQGQQIQRPFEKSFEPLSPALPPQAGEGRRAG